VTFFIFLAAATPAEIISAEFEIFAGIPGGIPGGNSGGIPGGNSGGIPGTQYLNNVSEYFKQQGMLILKEW